MTEEELFEIKQDFRKRFTLAGVGCPSILDETANADDLWQWILEHFLNEPD